LGLGHLYGIVCVRVPGNSAHTHLPRPEWAELGAPISPVARQFRTTPGLRNGPAQDKDNVAMVVHAGDLKGQRFQVVEHPNDFFLKFRGDVPMTRYMTVSSQPAVSLLESVMIAEKTRTDIGVAVLKKAQDVTKAQGAAMIELLEEVGSNSVAEHLDVYA